MFKKKKYEDQNYNWCVVMMVSEKLHRRGDEHRYGS